MCESCTVAVECLLSALVVDDPGPITDGFSDVERAAIFAAAETNGVLLEPWLRDRARRLRGTS